MPLLSLSLSLFASIQIPTMKAVPLPSLSRRVKWKGGIDILSLLAVQHVDVLPICLSHFAVANGGSAAVAADDRSPSSQTPSLEKGRDQIQREN